MAAALQLMALAAGPTQFEQLSALLRSPYLAALERKQCLAIDLWLREHNIGERRPRGCCSGWWRWLAVALGDAAAAVLRG